MYGCISSLYIYISDNKKGDIKISLLFAIDS